MAAGRCCKFDFSRGAQAVGILLIVNAFTAFIFAIYNFAQVTEQQKELAKHGTTGPHVEMGRIMTFLIIAIIAKLLLGILLLVGVDKRSRKLCLCWLGIMAVLTTAYMVWIIVDAVDGIIYGWDFVMPILSMLTATCMIWIVAVFITELKAIEAEGHQRFYNI